MPSEKRTADDLSPSLKHYLMAGCPDRSNLHYAHLAGWMETLLMVYPRTPKLLESWRLHRASLIAEAAAAGFTPFGLLLEDDPDRGDVLPPDPARQAWSRAFCEEARS